MSGSFCKAGVWGYLWGQGWFSYDASPLLVLKVADTPAVSGLSLDCVSSAVKVKIHQTHTFPFMTTFSYF